MAAATPWWAPHVHADRRPFLLARARITAALRAFFAARDFIEVEAAILQVSPGNEAHLHAFATELVTPAAQRVRRYLHTSPEFAAKKLLAAGERRIFEFARVFRNRARGRDRADRIPGARGRPFRSRGTPHGGGRLHALCRHRSSRDARRPRAE